LFSRGGDSIVDRIRSENIAAQFVTHELLGVAEILFTTLQDRLRFVWVTRHPVHLLPYFAAYLERYDHVREFTLSVENDGSRIPWFGRQFASDWIRLSAGERAVLCIDYLIRLSWSFLDQHSAVTNRVLVVEFETFVCDPTPTMHQLQELLGRQLHPHSARLLRRANIPRPSPSADGRTFSSLAQSAASSDARSERLRYREILKAHLKSGARENRKLFETLVRDYDRRHPTVLAAYADEFTEIHTR
jgi:hypothetical protein